MSRIKYGLTAEEVFWIEQVLSNDEEPSNEEMLAYFIANGLTLDQAGNVMAHRDDYLLNIYFDGQGPLFE